MAVASKDDKVVMVSLPQAATTAPLKNVALLTRALERAMNRPSHLPGMVAVYGPAGYGKSVAAAYAANRHRAYYVQCASAWTKKALLTAILREMGIAAAKTLYEMVDQIAEQLVLSGRPLIVDEMDHIVEKKAVEIIRDLYEASNAPILMIGEEYLPAKLKRWERFHSRMLEWQPAQPCDLDDARALARLYAGDIAIADDLMREMHQQSAGSARRICINVEKIRQEAAAQGVDRMNAERWGNRAFYTGNPPPRRK